MAKIKTPEQLAEQTNIETKETAQTAATVKDNKTAATVKDIPENVKHLLEIFSNLEEVYIDEKGGVFSEKPSNSEGAILYKNPFFSK